MKKICRFLSVIVCLVFMCTATSVTAVSDDQMVNEKKYNSEYGFSYTEYKDSENRTIRTYTKSDNSTVFTNRAASTLSSDEEYLETSIEETKAILATLGLDESFIEEISDDDLNTYSECKKITSIAYSAEAYPTEEEENSGNSSRSSDILLPPHEWTGPEDGDGSIFSNNDSEYGVNFLLIVYDLGEGRYRCSLNATYFDMPEDRSWDGIGIVAQECTYDGNASAWMEYDCIEKNTDTGVYGEEFTLTYDMESAILTGMPSSDVCGCGLRYELWEDWESDSETLVECNVLRVHLEYECIVTNPSETTNFQVYASYAHMYNEISYTPSFGFGIPSGFTYSFWGETEKKVDEHVFCLVKAIEYLP